MFRLSIEQFLAGDQRSADIHLKIDGTVFKAYVRRSRRAINGEVRMNVLDLANFGIHRPTRAQMKRLDKPEMMATSGCFQKFLGALLGAAQAAGIDGIYIENVINPTLPEKLPKYGYSRLPTREPHEPPSFWRPCNDL